MSATAGILHTGYQVLGSKGDDQVAHYDDKTKKNLLQRLNRIEGQVRGIQRMVEMDQYCVDILNQISAVRSALSSVGQIILEDHMRGCVTDAIRENRGDESIAELMQVIKKYVR